MFAFLSLKYAINMKKSFIKTICVQAFIFMACSVFAQKIYTPAVGSAERKSILDGIRTPSQKELGQSIQFKVGTFNVLGDWCFLLATIQQANGKDIDIKKIADKDLIMGEGKDAFFENNIQVVLKKSKGRWTIVRRVLGCTDVCWSDWYVDLKAPKAVFGMK
jgi:hypothetical protein